MVTKSGAAAPRQIQATAAALRAQLEEAEALLAGGETVEAEKRAKAVTALVRAARDVAELDAFARAQPPEDDEEELRAEIRRRIARFVEADQRDAPAEEMERLAREAFSE